MDGRHRIFGLSCQQFVRGNLEMFHSTEYVSEVEAQAHLQAGMWHLRPTETLTAYLIYVK